MCLPSKACESFLNARGSRSQLGGQQGSWGVGLCVVPGLGPGCCATGPHPSPFCFCDGLWQVTQAGFELAIPSCLSSLNSRGDRGVPLRSVEHHMAIRFSVGS